MTSEQGLGIDPGRRSPWRIGLIAAVAVAALVLPAAAATADPQNAWTSGTGGPSNATDNPGESVVTAATAPQVRQRWTAHPGPGLDVAPTVVAGIVYYVDNPTGNAADPSRLVAASASTGARLWNLVLPAGQNYSDGMTVVGGRAVMAYMGNRKRAGITAVDLTARRVAWNRPFAELPPEFALLANWLPAELVADGQRVYVTGGSTNLSAFRLSDGAPVWSVSMRLPLDADRLAVANGVVYGGTGVNGSDGRGLTAWDAATGRKLWTAPGGGLPVIAGGRVFSTTGTAVTAAAAGGCGHSTCSALWTREIADLSPNSLTVGGASSGSLFAGYRDAGDRGRILRLSAATGAVQWSATTGSSLVSVPVRGADAIWAVSPSRTCAPTGGCTWTYRLQAFPATGTSARPLRTIVLPEGVGNAYLDVAVAAGAVLVQSSTGDLLAYRVPGR
jgi:outer membrane protein assembly factor BamB